MRFVDIKAGLLKYRPDHTEKGDIYEASANSRGENNAQHNDPGILRNFDPKQFIHRREPSTVGAALKFVRLEPNRFSSVVDEFCGDRMLFRSRVHANSKLNLFGGRQ